MLHEAIPHRYRPIILALDTSKEWKRAFIAVTINSLGVREKCFNSGFLWVKPWNNSRGEVTLIVYGTVGFVLTLCKRRPPLPKLLFFFLKRSTSVPLFVASRDGKKKVGEGGTFLPVLVISSIFCKICSITASRESWQAASEESGAA